MSKIHSIEERVEFDGFGDAEPVLFYKPNHEYGCFSNFSDHMIGLPSIWTGKRCAYATGEHRYQAMKADNYAEHELVVETNKPYQAKAKGGVVSLRDGWGNDYGDLCWYV